MTPKLEVLARRCGIALSYQDIDGNTRNASEEAIRKTLAALGTLPGDVDIAPSHMHPDAPSIDGSLRLSPGRPCFMPEWLSHGRVWGVAAQLYQLRSARDWGIGDFADLAQFAMDAAAAGADFIGLNPLHALFSANPGYISPFSPSNRRFLNPIYIAPDVVPGVDMADIDRQELARVRATDMVDYPAVFNLKLGALRAAFARWPATAPHDGAYASSAFARFRAEEGHPLELHALFEALSISMSGAGHGAGWQGWPQPFHRPDGAGTAAFARENAAQIEFHAWLQWLADVQLGQAQRAARDGGMRVGLYLDFAVGESPEGSAVWSDPTLTVPSLRVGAPPDMYSELGQDWGLAPVSPEALRHEGISSYRDVIARVMRHAGALRIDHAMGLYRLYVIPGGLSAKDGVYVYLPLGEILRTLSGLSHSCRTIVIGEDLGTVPDGFRRVMNQREIQSYRVMYFEREGGRLRAPARYPRRALVCLSTHDLPPLQGWWREQDITLRRRLGFISEAARTVQISERAKDRTAIVEQLARAGLFNCESGEPPVSLSVELATAIHAHLARAPSRLFGVRLEDLAGESEPVNVPGTVDEHPNWRRKLSLPTDALVASERFVRITEAVAAQRPRLP